VVKLHFDVQSTLSSMLTLLHLFPFNFCGSGLSKFWNKNVEEDDGRCVHSSFLSSIELSKFNLLLNPPYSLQFH
jgi:hypothetical protein